MAGYHIVLFYPGDPAPRYWHRDSERRMPDGGLAPEFSRNVQDAKFKIIQSATAAVAERDRFRKYWPPRSGYRFVIRNTVASAGSSDDLFEDRSASVGQTEAPVDSRVPHHTVVAGVDILISPGSDKNWYVRFVGSGIESLRGATPDEAAQKYAEAVALYPHIAQHVEKAPDISDEQLATTIRNAQDEIRRAALGPGRMRPGNR